MHKLHLEIWRTATGEIQRMKWRHPNLSAVMSWTIALALTLSPVMAQSTQDTAAVSIAPQNEEPAGIAKDQQTPIVDNSVLPELPKAKTVTAFPTVARNSTLPMPGLFPPAPGKPGTTLPSSGNNAPGQSKWVILAALIITGAVVGVILLLRGLGGGGDDSHSPNQLGTVIAAGTPAVTTPNH
jgi:hypothetical protein